MIWCSTAIAIKGSYIDVIYESLVISASSQSLIIAREALFSVEVQALESFVLIKRKRLTVEIHLTV